MALAGSADNMVNTFFLALYCQSWWCGAVHSSGHGGGEKGGNGCAWCFLQPIPLCCIVYLLGKIGGNTCE
jgi:hypothetical protein